MSLGAADTLGDLAADTVGAAVAGLLLAATLARRRYSLA